MKTSSGRGRKKSNTLRVNHNATAATPARAESASVAGYCGRGIRKAWFTRPQRWGAQTQEQTTKIGINRRQLFGTEIQAF